MLPVLKEVYLDYSENLDALERVVSSERLMTKHLATLENIVHRDVLGDYPAPTLNAIADLAQFKGLGRLLERFPQHKTRHEWVGPATELNVLAEFHRQGQLTSLPRSYRFGHGRGRGSSFSAVEVDGLISDANGEQFLEIKRLGASPAHWRWFTKTAFDQVGRAANLLRKHGLLVFAISEDPRDEQFMEQVKDFLSIRPQNRMPFRVAYVIAPLHKPLEPPVRLLFEPSYLEFNDRHAEPGSGKSTYAHILDSTKVYAGRPLSLGSKIVSQQAKEYQRFIDASLDSIRRKGVSRFR